MSVSPDAIRRALDGIRDNLRDGWTDGVTPGELRDNTRIIDRLAGDDANAVVAALSDGELRKWASEIHEGGFFGDGGLNAADRDALFDVLAADLDATQLLRFHDALDGESRRAELIDSIVTEAPADVRGDVIDGLAPRALDRPIERHVHQLGFGGTSREIGDDDALSIARLLASLGNDPAALDAAVAALDDETLEAVLVAGIEQSTFTPPSLTGSPSIARSHFFDPRTLVGVIEAATAGGNLETRTRIFDLAARRIDDVRATDTLLSPNPSAAGTAGSIADALGALLASDTTGIVTALESGSVNESHRYGDGLSSYTAEIVRQGDLEPLTVIIAKLQSGESLDVDPETFLSRHTENAQGARNYQNASNLGYFVGAVREGIGAIESDAQRQAEIVSAIFGTAFGIATPFLPSGQLAPKVAATIARTLTLEGLNARAADLSSGRASLGEALEQLAWPDGVNNSDLEGPFETTSQRVQNN